MPVTSTMLKNIVAEARPIIERQLNDAKLIAGFRDLVTANGGDWSALKALIKAHVEDENDETGNGKRVRKILDKADSSTAYADMLGLANMNEKNFSQEEFDAETGEIFNTPPTKTRQDRAKERMSESMDDHKALSRQMLDAGLISEESHAENIALSDAVATKYGVGPVSEGESFQPPAFLIRDKPLRPHCLRPEMCASGFPKQHCHTCRKAMEANEVAA